MWNETKRLAEEGKTYEAPPPAPRPEAQSYQTQLSPEAVRTLLRVIEVRVFSLPLHMEDFLTLRVPTEDSFTLTIEDFV